jgi:hypothetical protein
MWTEANAEPIFHIPATLSLVYDPCDVHPGGEVELRWYLTPEDGDGFEYDFEQGTLIEVNLMAWSPNFKVALDFEADFSAPFTNSNPDVFQDFAVGALGWGKNCLIEVGVGPLITTTFEGHQFYIPIRITNPPSSDQVKWKSGGQLHNLNFLTKIQNHVPDMALLKSTLEISPTYLGSIELAVEDPSAWLHQTDDDDIGLNVTIPDCIFGYDRSATGEFTWTSRDQYPRIELKSDDSDDLKWELESADQDCLPGGGKQVQDLSQESYRSGATEWPIIGEPDTILTVIRNAYSDVCSPYTSVSVNYYVDEGLGPVFIGNSTLTGTVQQLIDFNNGVVDSMITQFVYAPTNPEYIFTKSHAWVANDGYPCYVSEINPVAAAACPNWVVVENLTISSSNNRRVVSFSEPLPDFAFTELNYEGLAYADPNDTLIFDLKIKNRGIGWPPFFTMSEPADSVYVDGRVSFERRIGGEWNEVYINFIDAQLITPMAASGDGTFHFEYITPSEQTLQLYDPDRVRISFDVNDGSNPIDWVVWEKSFDNNTVETVLSVSHLPIVAYTSQILHIDGQAIIPGYRNFYAYAACPQYVYLYVADPSFSFSPPNIPPTGFLAQLGEGPQLSSPNDPTWTWVPVTYVKDFIDDNGDSYKVYRGNGCSLPLASANNTYIFRVSFDYSDEDRHYAFVDSDGWRLEKGAFNLYSPALAGRIYISIPSLSSWGIVTLVITLITIGAIVLNKLGGRTI